MTELDDYRNAWRQLGSPDAAPSATTAGSRRETAQIQRAAARLDTLVRLRDRGETVVALLLLPVFTWLAYATPHALSRAGAIIIALCCLIVPLRLRRARRPPPDLTRPLALAIADEVARIEAQRDLLNGLFWWYAGPLWLGVTLFIIGPLDVAPAVLVTLVTTLLMAWLVYRNRALVRDELDGWSEELRSVAGQLSEPAPHDSPEVRE
jgi:hypothetical protein